MLNDEAEGAREPMGSGPPWRRVTGFPLGSPSPAEVERAGSRAGAIGQSAALLRNRKTKEGKRK